MRFMHFCLSSNTLAYLEEWRKFMHDSIPDNSEEEVARRRLLELVCEMAREVEAAKSKKTD